MAMNFYVGDASVAYKLHISLDAPAGTNINPTMSTE